MKDIQRMNSIIYDKIINLSKLYSFSSFKYLMHNHPVFPVHNSQIKILLQPQEFYEELIKKSAQAKERIVITSLYIGTGHLENKLVSSISERLKTQSKLRVKWLLDYTRATRGTVNSCKTLLPLLNSSDTCKVSLFHTPLLRGVYKMLMPERWNEIMGLQHMKIYVYDDSVIISGANLSNDYFVNRQDRYYMVNNCKDLADFFELLINEVSNHSFQLKSDNSFHLKDSSIIHPYLGNFKEYCKAFEDTISKFWHKELEKSIARLTHLADSALKEERNGNTKELFPDTFIFPSVQMPHFGIRNDSNAILNFLKNAPECSRIHLASGYFNLTDQFMDTIINESHSYFKILCAHPKANGFLGAKGFAGGIPTAYTNLCKRFYAKVIQSSLRNRISVYEFQIPGWTFHAKGLWYFPPGSENEKPLATLVGSPNFGYRSVYRDLEAQLFVVTSSSQLRHNMFEEQNRLFESSSVVTPKTFIDKDRIVPMWVKLVTFFMKYYF